MSMVLRQVDIAFYVGMSMAQLFKTPSAFLFPVFDHPALPGQ
jgi:hypothetical protein